MAMIARTIQKTLSRLRGGSRYRGVAVAIPNNKNSTKTVLNYRASFGFVIRRVTDVGGEIHLQSEELASCL